MKVLNWNTHPNNKETIKALDMFDDLRPDIITLQEVSEEFFCDIKDYARERDLHVDKTLDWRRRGVPFYLVTMLKDSYAQSQSLPHKIRRHGLVARSIGWEETLNFSVSTSSNQTILNGHLEHHTGPITRGRQLDEILAHLGKDTNVIGIDLNHWFPFERGRTSRLLARHGLKNIVNGSTTCNGFCLDGIIVDEVLAQGDYTLEKMPRLGSDHYPIFAEFYDS
tara:strand:+ start:66 stop:734 length:669 start_codon:yes stop_codon:yes gene_type:complete